MKISSYCLLLIVLLVFDSSSLPAQSPSYQSNHQPGRMSASFSRFNAVDKVAITANAGDVLFVNWKIAVTKGAISIVVKNKKQVIYKSLAIDKNDTADFYIPIKNAGGVSIQMQGKKADGNLLLLYEKTAPKNIQVKTNSNIELFGLLMQLDNAADAIAAKDSVEINGRKSTWKDWYALAVKNYNRYKGFDSSNMMQLYRQYISRGLYNDYFIGLLLQADEVPNAGLNDRVDDDVIMAFSKTGNREDAQKEAAVFFKAFNQFYHDVKFDDYLKEYEPYLTTMKMQVQKNLPPAAFVPVMEHFYHKQFNGYCFVPGFDILNTMGFGKMNKEAGIIYNAFGPFDFMKFDQDHPDPGFDFPEKIQNLAVHEFGHSFVNPAIDKLPADLIQATAHLYEPIKEKMSQHAYTEWKICLYEHFVRAGEVIISRYLDQKEKADQMLNNFVKDGFIYVPFIVQELEQYEKIPFAERDYDAFVKLAMEHLRDAKDFK